MLFRVDDMIGTIVFTLFAASLQLRKLNGTYDPEGAQTSGSEAIG